jgi:hypothetical protein
MPDDDDKFFRKLAKLREEPKESYLQQMSKSWREAYPVGTLMKVIKDVIDPIKNKTLVAGLYVTVKDFDITNIRSGPKWIVCEDSEKELWNVPRTYLMKNTTASGKRGRFRILAQDALMEKLTEKHNKES